MTQRFNPVRGQDHLGGAGNVTFGSTYFTPTVSNLTGTYSIKGQMQKVGRLVFFNVSIIGSATTLSSVLTVPIKPSRYSTGAAADEVSAIGQMHDEGNLVFQNTDGTFTLGDDTTTTSRRLTGWYWVD